MLCQALFSDVVSANIERLDKQFKRTDAKIWPDVRWHTYNGIRICTTYVVASMNTGEPKIHMIHLQVYIDVS